MMDNFFHNGVEFPELPEWDRKMHPYAVLLWCAGITKSLGGEWPTEYERTYARLIVSDQPLFYAEGTSANTYLVAKNPVNFLDCYTTDEKGSGTFSSDLSAAVWEDFESHSVDTTSDFAETGLGSYNVEQVYYTMASWRYDWKPHWSNHAIYNLVTGELYLADPVPVDPPAVAPTIHPASFLQGWLVGQRVRIMRGRKKPIAYLYNGIQLPALPKWDKTAYPYATISRLGITTVLQIQSEPFYYNTETGEIWRPDANWYTYKIGYRDTDWVLFTEPKYGVVDGFSPPTEEYPGNTGTWSNTDIMSTDGSVYFAGSKPIPVYE